MNFVISTKIFGSGSAKIRQFSRIWILAAKTTWIWIWIRATQTFTLACITRTEEKSFFDVIRYFFFRFQSENHSFKDKVPVLSILQNLQGKRQRIINRYYDSQCKIFRAQPTNWTFHKLSILTYAKSKHYPNKEEDKNV